MPIKITKIKPEFVENRGFIARIIDQEKLKIKAILYIESKAGSIRGNHYHKTECHYVYCLSGKFKYSERNIQSHNSHIESRIIKPGNLVLTHPMVVHAMEFIEDSVFMAFTTKNREQIQYEKDTVRLKITKNDKESG